MKKIGRLLFAAAIVVGLAACSGGGDGGDDPANVVGTWRGAYKMTQVPGPGAPVIVKLVQDGSNVAGTSQWTTRTGCDVSGTVDGNKIELVFRYRNNWAPDVVSGTVEGDHMVLSGTDGTYQVSYDIIRVSNTLQAGDLGVSAAPGESDLGVSKRDAIIRQ
ncbi:MAG TPA: hypothetical protein VI078_08460 [bacterium]